VDWKRLLILLGILALGFGPAGFVIFYNRSRSPNNPKRTAAFARFARERSYPYYGSLHRTVAKTARMLEQGVDTSRVSGRKRDRLRRDIEIYGVLFPADGISVGFVTERDARASNLMMIPRDDGDQFVFDYAYKDRNPSAGSRIEWLHQSTFAVFRSPTLSGGPAFSVVAAETYRQWVSRRQDEDRARLVERTVSFDDHPGFAQAYAVLRESGDSDTIRRILTPAVLEVLAGLPGYHASAYESGLVIADENKWVTLTSSGLTAVERLDGLIRFNYEIARAMMAR